MNYILEAKMDYLIDYAKKEFSEYRGLHKNSKDWESFVTVSEPSYFSFLINGTVKWHTDSAISNERYNQLMKLSDYKKMEAPILLMFLLNISESEISNFISEFLSSTEVKLFCPCKWYQYGGIHYNLTKINSNYGKGENRPPIIKDPNQNNLVCKHLWLLLMDYKSQIPIFANGLIPYYKRYFGMSNISGIKRTRIQLGEKGIRKIIEQSVLDLNKIGNKTLYNMFLSITKGNLDKALNTEIVPTENTDAPKYKTDNKLEINKIPNTEENTNGMKPEEINKNKNEIKDRMEEEIKKDKIDPDNMSTEEIDDYIKKKKDELGDAISKDYDIMMFKTKFCSKNSIIGTKLRHNTNIVDTPRNNTINPSDLDKFLIES